MTTQVTNSDGAPWPTPVVLYVNAGNGSSSQTTVTPDGSGNVSVDFTFDENDLIGEQISLNVYGNLNSLWDWKGDFFLDPQDGIMASHNPIPPVYVADQDLYEVGVRLLDD